MIPAWQLCPDCLSSSLHGDPHAQTHMNTHASTSLRSLLIGLSLLPITAFAQIGDYLKKPSAWYSSKEARTIARNVISYQSDLGGWPKNTVKPTVEFRGHRKDLRPTFDNGATMDEMRLLARIHQATRDRDCATAFQRGLHYILKAQYPNGGWPQSFPLSTQYHRHITFNDGSMVRVMMFVREVSTDRLYSFVDARDRDRAEQAFAKGLDCILRCQIRLNGQLTVWCAQHDEITLEPRKARSYELASLSGSESVGITRLLMSIEKPTPEVARAVDAAVAWFERSAIRGIRIETIQDPKARGGKDRIVKRDPKARPLWARFYDLKNQRPMFCDRDGIPKANFADIGHERRNGYSWYGNWAQSLIEKEYPRWKKTHARVRR
jgi:PelA/Pel-15E family pectate lyase